MTFSPRLFATLRHYDRKTFMQDLMAGIIVGIVALPLAIAFGIASGVTPEKGIITAIVAGFIISVFGGSKVQIGGPTGAFIVIIYGIIQQYGMEGLTIATLMAGVFLILFGVLHLGTIIKYIPYPIVVGFTSGIAVTIFTTQIKDLFGLQMQTVPSDFLEKWGAYIQDFHTIDPWSALIGVLSVVIIVITPKFSKRIPGSLIAIIVMTLVALGLQKYCGATGIETIGDRFTISSQLPAATLPGINWDTIKNLISPAFTIAILGAIESLLSSTVADGVTGTHTRTNTELIGQGIANMAVPFFGGIPVTGAIARTMTNISNGGRTPVAGVIHAVVLLLIFLFLMPLINLIPMACLAAVLIVVSYNMSGWRTIRSIFSNPKSDITVLAVTFFLTVIFDLTIAIEIGLILAVILFLRRVMENTEIKAYSGQLEVDEDTELSRHEVLDIHPGVEVYEINGPFFFGVATKFDELMRTTIGEKPKVRIIRMRKVPFIDSTAIHNLETLITSSRQEGIHVVLSGVKENVRESLLHAGIDRIIGADHICPHISVAVEMANRIASQS